ncbi:hypothetical protein LINPERHAP2_LOCUS3865 [Linum perenne]
MAYVINAERCSITRVEIRGIVEGMRLAWDDGIRRLVIQIDSKRKYTIIDKNKNSNRQHAKGWLTIEFQNMLKLGWKFGR